jgi:hypothetical protein|tara:strand:- start:3937 stop:4323 length:387 start_codon:yes stop_codon:yes gene_type:complete
MISSGLAYNIAKQEVENSRQFRVVDIKKLTEASMENVKEMITSSDVQLNQQAIELIAQNEAKKMFENIALASKGKDIILPKTSALFTPDGYEITAQIAESMGLKGVENSTFNARINKAKKSAAQNADN